jgi:hypothetical protein
LKDLQESLGFLHHKYELLVKHASARDFRVKELEEENSSLKSEMGKLRLQSLEMKTGSMTWNNMVVASENANDLVCEVASIAGVEISPADVSACHRIKPKTATDRFPPSIIVKLVSRDTRDELYRVRGALRDHNTTEISSLRRHPKNDIYISESLTEKNRALFNKALKCRKDLKYKCIWTVYGKVYLRRDEDSPAVYVKSEEVIERLRQQAADATARQQYGFADD